MCLQVERLSPGPAPSTLGTSVNNNKQEHLEEARMTSGSTIEEGSTQWLKDMNMKESIQCFETSARNCNQRNASELQLNVR